MAQKVVLNKLKSNAMHCCTCKITLHFFLPMIASSQRWVYVYMCARVHAATMFVNLMLFLSFFIVHVNVFCYCAKSVACQNCIEKGKKKDFKTYKCKHATKCGILTIDRRICFSCAASSPRLYPYLSLCLCMCVCFVYCIVLY